MLIEIARAEIVVLGAAPEQVVGDDEDGVPDGDRGLVPPAPGGQAAVLRREVGVLLAGGGVGRLDQQRAGCCQVKS
ncbi:MAG: hypothetical protein M3Q65_13480 [Chloroflexota bacterium]|nr:hypothetical protein [Chloroflexota bacterium]